MRYQAVIAGCFGVLLTLLPAANAAAGSRPHWVPTRADTFQWDLQTPVPLTVAASVYDIDLFDNPPRVVQQLHNMGRHAICYVDVGSWENYRPDAKTYPARILGKSYPGYPDERFIDIRQLNVLGPILAKRFDLCRAKGFDAVEPDNIDTYQADTGFPITYRDQLVFNHWLVAQTHLRGLSIGQKNDGDQVRDLVGSFDWALLEECFNQQFCTRFSPYVASGKAVFDTEYREDVSVTTFLQQYCPNDRSYGYYLIYKKLALDSYRVTCRGHVDTEQGFAVRLGGKEKRSPEFPPTVSSRSR